MSIKNVSGLGRALVLAVATALLAGCHSGPQPWNLSIYKSTTKSIRVDLIGVNESSRSDWENYPVTQYWAEGDPRRADAQPLSMVLEPGQTWVVSKTDKIWQQWKKDGDTELLILADIPEIGPSGSYDPRRRFLPLSKADWDAKNGTLEIEIKSTMINVKTPQLTKEK